MHKFYKSDQVALAVAGAKVVVNYATAKDGADKVVSNIRQTGGTAIAVQADVTSAADVKRLFKEAQDAFGQLDILVNNAGVFKVEKLEAVTKGSFHLQTNTHVKDLP